jgi:glycosyltransferase involved in cell wall biosynthesis
MRILFVVGRFPELTFIFRMIAAVAERGHTVTVAARAEGNWTPFREYLPLPSTIHVTYLLPDGGFSDTMRIRRLFFGLPLAVLSHPRDALRLWKTSFQHPELKHAHRMNFIRYVKFLPLEAEVIQYDFSMTEIIYPYLTTLLDAPTIVSCRGADIHTLEHKSGGWATERIDSIRRATVIHCVSEEMKQEVFRLTGRDQHVYVNRPAVDIHRLNPTQAKPQNSIPLILCVGRLTWKKGYDYLLAAFSRLKEGRVAFQAEILGDGELYNFLRFSIEDLGLSDQVKLRGRVSPDEVQKQLQRADLYVLSSHEEGISNAVLEAMAMGLPVVTTNAGGMAEVVRDGVEGFIVPVRDTQAMADKLKLLLEDADLRQRMGKAGRARIEAEFTLERQARVFEEMYAVAREVYESRKDIK